MRINKKTFNRIEFLILMISILCVFSLVLLQGVLNDNNNPVFQYFNNMKFLNNYEPDISKEIGYIILKLNNEKFGDALVVINGSGMYKFNDDLEIKVKVHNNDIIEIDSSMYKEDFKIKVIGISKNIVTPKLNTEISTNGDFSVVGTVILN